MIIVTGATGFIGSNIAKSLNSQGRTDLVLVDDFSDRGKRSNWSNLLFQIALPHDQLFHWFEENNDKVTYVIHMGAITDTMCTDMDFINRMNLEYTKSLWVYCSHYKIPFIYASSASTYGDGKCGYQDSSEKIFELMPLNHYAASKQQFDIFATHRANPPFDELDSPPKWYGLKFFNVYGPGEWHKEKMASVVLHAWQDVLKTDTVHLFKSYKEGIADGEQMRDFVYVKDICNVILWLMKEEPEEGIYNLGTGQARSYNDLARAVFKALDLRPEISYIEMPEELKDKYQYFTEADMSKLRAAGYKEDFYSLEEGVYEYINE